MSEKLLDGKVVLVTGAGRGIGRDIAIAMAKSGAKVVINDLGATDRGEGADASPAAEAVNAIKEAGGEAVSNGDSVASWDGAHRMVKAAIDNFGRIDCVVNNAGILRDAIFHKMEEADWDAVVGVHLKGSFNVARAAAPHFREQNGGSFIHMTSNSALIGQNGQANYIAAKLGIVGLSKGIALDMQRFGIRSNCISPSAWSRLTGTVPVETEQQKARRAKIMAMTPDKIAPVAVYLASDASKEVSGQIFAVRQNEIFVFNHNRPIRSVHRSEGWTASSIADHAMPALRSWFTPLQRSGEVFRWDPV
ncbi:MAG: 3-hydroxyacyl-CoA dehydrogenase [Alphaproteobacteria bacterium]|nr:3-hydroxyacyl-CoA dehydrogenase [Alphaproteobacteria bacterium]